MQLRVVIGVFFVFIALTTQLMKNLRNKFTTCWPSACTGCTTNYTANFDYNRRELSRQRPLCDIWRCSSSSSRVIKCLSKSSTTERSKHRCSGRYAMRLVWRAVHWPISVNKRDVWAASSSGGSQMWMHRVTTLQYSRWAATAQRDTHMAAALTETSRGTLSCRDDSLNSQSSIVITPTLIQFRLF